MDAVLQYNEKDCGVAAICMLYNHYSGKDKISIADLTSFIGKPSDGSSVFELAMGAEKLGMAYEAYYLDSLEELIAYASSNVPFIVHTVNEEMGHYIVVEEVTAEGIKVVDPAVGVMVYTTERFKRIWTRVVLRVYPGANFPVAVPKKNYLKKCFRDAWKYKGKLVLVLFLAVLVSVAGVGAAMFFQKFVDYILPAKDICLLLKSTFVLTIVYVALHLLDAIREREISKFLYRFRTDMLKQFMDAVKRSARTGNRSHGDISSRFDDLQEVLQSIPELILQGALQTIMIGFGAIVLALSAPQIFVIVLVLSSIQVITAVGLNRPVIKRYKILRGSNNALQNHLISVHSGFVEHDSQKWGEKWCEACYRAERIVDTRGALLGVMDSLLNVAVLTFGGITLINGYTTIGAIMSSYMLVGYITDPLMSLLGLYTVYQNATAAAERIADLDV